MIKSITAINHLGEELELELTNPYKTGLAVKEIRGLGPVKANINTTEVPTMDGVLYNSGRALGRNIVLTLAFIGSPTIEDSRHKTYKYFPLKKPVSIHIETDTRYLETYGYVEHNEPNIFSNLETAEISIVCPNAYFWASPKGEEDAVQSITFSGIEGGFEFIFEDEPSPILEFGQIQEHAEKNIYYTGDTDTGLVVIIDAFGPASDIEIIDVDSRATMSIDGNKLAAITGGGISYGDQITISTVPGQKQVTLLRGGRTINILNALGKDIEWFKLSKGDNIFAYKSASGSENLRVTIQSRVLYEGV